MADPGTAATVLGVPLDGADWLWRLPGDVTLPPGTPAPVPLRVPDPAATRLLRATAATVADLPAGSGPTVVWVRGTDEVEVHLDTLTVATAPGVVTVGVDLVCTQLPAPATMSVPFGVGTDAVPTGLVMTTFDRPVGPDLVAATWGEAVTAFAWAALVHLAEQLCAQVGTDPAGQQLVPGALGAAAGLLLVQPMARHLDGVHPS